MYAPRGESLRTDAAHDQKSYHSHMGESDSKTYSTLQPPTSTFPVSRVNTTNSRFAHYDLMDGDTAVASPTGVNFVGSQSGQQNVLDSQTINRHFSQDESGGFLTTSLQNCSPTTRTDPIAGLAQLAEKANFTAEMSDFGDTRSGVHSRNSLPRIDRNISFPSSPTLRTAMMDASRAGYEHFREGFQGSFLDDSINSSLYPVRGSTMSDMAPSRHHIRQQQRQTTYIYPEHGLEQPYNHYKYSDDRELRSFDYYQTLTKDKSVIPNVTVFNTDPQTKSARFFAPVKSRSEEILKKTLSTFGKILSPTEGEDQGRDGDKWPNTTDNRKDKRCCPSTKGSGRNGTTPEQSDDRLCACKWMGCDAIYSEQDDLVRHLEKVHIDQRKADDLYICYWEQCTRQTKPFNARYKLVIHMRVHSGEKPNKCTVSGTPTLSGNKRMYDYTTSVEAFSFSIQYIKQHG